MYLVVLMLTYYKPVVLGDACFKYFLLVSVADAVGKCEKDCDRMSLAVPDTMVLASVVLGLF